MADDTAPRTLAELQRDPRAPAPVNPARLPIAVSRTRTFDTPEFAGMTFLEVEAKSALNKVSGMPFGWSINPYRGCSHACSYCLAGDTHILMADGRTRPLADVRPGDRIYGTRRQARYRRYVTTEVLDHWETIKPAYRVTLTDGMRLVTSADHRFLTHRGWKHVTGAQQGRDRRPHLARSDVLPGTSGKAVRAGEMVRQLVPVGVESIEPLGVELPLFDITTGTGDFVANGVISHNCFARPTHAYLNLSPLGDFERTVVVKTNVADVLRRELARRTWKGEHVAMGTNTDPYQRCEGRYRLMPGIIRALAESRTPFSVLTKGTLITRDLDELVAAMRQVPVTAAMTIGMLDEELWRRAEPGTPSPAARLRAVRQLNDAGIPTGIMLAPIMPGLNDDPEQLAALVDAAAQAGASHITPIVLHLRPGVREVFWPWLEAEHPELVARYEALYRRSQASREYADGVLGEVRRARAAAWRRHGRPAEPPAWRRSGMGTGASPPGDGLQPPPGEQLSLL